MIQLREYQERSKLFIKNALFKYGGAIDASDTGTGKTYVALAVAKEIKLPVLVICPKTIKTKWLELGKAFGIQEMQVVSLEKYVYDRSRKVEYKRGLIIWDECHRGQAKYNTKTVKVMSKVREEGNIVLLLSATAIGNPLRMRATASILGLCKYGEYFRWILTNGCKTGYWGGYEFAGKEIHIRNLYEEIFNKGKGVRIRIQDLPKGEFPDNEIYVEPIDIDEEKAREINDNVEKFKNGLLELGDLVLIRKAIEEAKLEAIREEVDDLVNEGRSVVVFLSFIDNIDLLANSITSNGVIVITGEIKEEARARVMQEFAEDNKRVIICQIACGGVGLSLHDLRGVYPRVSIISPDFSAVNLKQALGRIYRQGAKTKCVQKIVIAKGTIEENIIYKLDRAIKQMALGNDGALDKEDLTEVFQQYKIERDTL